MHFGAFNQYDFFRDELYFIVCGRHPAFGYVDQPPLVPLLAAVSQSAGESLWLLRIIPAVFAAGAVLATCAIARRLGGGRSAQVAAGLATATAPLLLGVTATLGTTALEPLSWTLVAYAALRAELNAQPRWWIVAGIIAGITLEAKYTLAFFLIAISLAIALAGPRAALRRPEYWLGAAVTLLLAAPSLVWQAGHGWPLIELLHAGAATKNVVRAPIAWLADQILIVSPLFAPLWIAGIVLLLRRARARFLGVAVLLTFAVFIALHAKNYYTAGIYPLLFAAGGVALERALRSPGLRATYAAVAVASALAFAPLAIPLLPEPLFISYAVTLQRILHLSQEQIENHKTALLPQTFADMHGWHELADRVASVERTLAPAERAQAAVFTQNYGEAAAIDVFGPASVPVISGHNTYYLWGPRGAHPVLIIVGGNLRDHQRVFGDVRHAATFNSRYAMPYENDLPIYVGRKPRVDLRAFWHTLRHYN